MAPRRTELSETEQEILKSLWDDGPGTVREVHERMAQRGRQWAYTTVLTFLTRLETKGYVASDRSGAAHVYRSIVSREKLLSQRLVELADHLCDGTATPLVQALVKGGHFSPDDVAQFRRMLDELEAEPPTRRAPRAPRRKG